METISFDAMVIARVQVLVDMCMEFNEWESTHADEGGLKYASNHFSSVWNAAEGILEERFPGYSEDVFQWMLETGEFDVLRAVGKIVHS